MAKTDKKNAGLMNLIKRMHGVVENVDIGLFMTDRIFKLNIE